MLGKISLNLIDLIMTKIRSWRIIGCARCVGLTFVEARKRMLDVGRALTHIVTIVVEDEHQPLLVCLELRLEMDKLCHHYWCNSPN